MIPTILLVGDEPAHRAYLHDQLQAAGYSTIEAADGVEALAALDGETVDAVLSGVFLPRLDGYQLCVRARRQERLAGVPVILYGPTFAGPEDEELAKRVGAAAVLREPVNPEVLRATLAAALARRARRGATEGPEPAPRAEAGTLTSLEWMLAKRAATVAGPGAAAGQQPYGDLTRLNRERTILDAVGVELLRDIVGDYLNLLETSSAVYEKNGDYAFGLFSSGWCRSMDLASFARCGTDDAALALRCGAWHCHESCWNEASRPSMTSGGAIDVACQGGIRLYAVPIRAGDEVVGSINFGYGAPPRDPARLGELAGKYGLPLVELERNAAAYENRPAFIIELAKERLHASARLIGEIVRRKRAEDELRRVNASLESRVAARTAELEASVEELEAFSYSVSHDLRAPLRSIEGFSKILVAEHAAELSAAAREHLERVRASTQHMGRLIEDLLAFARLNRQPLRWRTVAMDALVRACLDLLQAGTGDRRIDVVTGALPACVGDPGLLEVVWMNLLSNALKYSRTRDPARIEVGYGGGEAPAYFVRDNGVGFDMAYAGKLFGVFQRLHRAEEYEGTGVGLATAQRIVHRHGGRIWAESSPGAGAGFYFTLPPARRP